MHDDKYMVNPKYLREKIKEKKNMRDKFFGKIQKKVRTNKIQVFTNISVGI